VRPVPNILVVLCVVHHVPADRRHEHRRESVQSGMGLSKVSWLFGCGYIRECMWWPRTRGVANLHCKWFR
jgi:hypothetical protein